MRWIILRHSAALSCWHKKRRREAGAARPEMRLEFYQFGLSFLFFLFIFKEGSGQSLLREGGTNSAMEPGTTFGGVGGACQSNEKRTERIARAFLETYFLHFS